MEVRKVLFCGKIPFAPPPARWPCKVIEGKPGTGAGIVGCARLSPQVNVSLKIRNPKRIAWVTSWVRHAKIYLRFSGCSPVLCFPLCCKGLSAVKAKTWKDLETLKLDLGSSAFGRGSSNLTSRTSGNCRGLAQAGLGLFFGFLNRIIH